MSDREPKCGDIYRERRGKDYCYWIVHRGDGRLTYSCVVLNGKPFDEEHAAPRTVGEHTFGAAEYIGNIGEILARIK